LVLLLGGASCEQVIERPTDIGPLSIEVTPQSGAFGTADEVVAFEGPHTFRFDLRAVDHEGMLDAGFSGDLHLRVRPNGELMGDEYVAMVDGVAEGVEVSVAGVHGEVQIWFEDVAEDESGSYATGLSPSIFVARPTIRNMQEYDDVEANALEGDFVRLRAEDRELVVTATSNDGFYVTDVSDAAWNSLFVFTHSAPHGVYPGARITQLDGTAEEFFGLTELAFPSYKVDGELAMPDPFVLGTADLADDLLLESHEGGLVEVQNATVCPVDSDFAQYGQWTAVVGPDGDCSSGNGAITVLSAFTVSDFNPAVEEGQILNFVRGNLRYHVAADPPWILTPRWDDDLQP
jgi:hypothetical protein